MSRAVKTFFGVLGLAAALTTLVVLVGCKKPAKLSPVQVAAAETAAIEAPPPRVPSQRVLDVPLWTQTIAVMDIQFTQQVPVGVNTRDYAQPITEQIESAFLTTGRFDLVERTRLERVKKELTSTTDPLWFDQSSVAKMGKFLGAKFVILSSANLEVGIFGTREDVKIKVVDTATASIVQTFDARSASASVSTNSSVTSVLAKIQLEIRDAIAATYPAQGVIVRLSKPGIIWAESKHVGVFKAGQKVRILRNEEVFNPIKNSNSPFLSEICRGRVQSVEAFGIVVKVPSGALIEEGWLLEALP